MTKKEAVFQLLKHLAIGVVTAIILGSITGETHGETIGETIGMTVLLTFAVGGLPFGWKLVSGWFSARTIMSVIVKAFISILVGWVIYPITLVKDIIAIIKA